MDLHFDFWIQLLIVLLLIYICYHYFYDQPKLEKSIAKK